MKKTNIPKLTGHSTVPTASGRRALHHIIFLLISLLLPGVIGGQVTLSWNRHPEASVNSYKVYYGTQSRNYSGSVPSTDISRTVTDLAPGTTYYFTVTAINTSGLESDPCPEVTAVTPGTAPPIITQQPQSQSVVRGGPATFSVGATGASLTYQWKRGTEILPGNGSTYSITSAQDYQAGNYTVVVSNPGGSVTSSAAALTLIGDLASGNFDGSTGLWTKTGNVNFSTGVGVNGSTAASFNAGQQPPNGSISQTFATKRGQAYKLSFDYGAFSMVNTDEQRVEVKVQGGSQLLLQTVSANAPGNGTSYKSVSFSFTADSDTATLTFRDASATTMNVDSYVDNVRVEPFQSAPVIVQQPASCTVLPAEGATFTVVANGSGLSYQWYLGSTQLQNATGPSYVITSAQANQAGSYTVTVSNNAGSVTSSPAILTVQAPPPPKVFSNGSFESRYDFWTVSGNHEIISGSSTEGSLTAAFNTGQRTPNAVFSQTFQTTPGQAYTLDFDYGTFSLLNTDEQRAEVKLQGKSELLLQNVSANAPGNGTRYKAVKFSFTADSDATTITFRDLSVATMNVDSYIDNIRIQPLVAAPVITGQPSSRTVQSGQGASFTVAATGQGLAYQWYFGSTKIQNETGPSYVITSAQATQAGNYYVVVSNVGGSVTSSTATLTVQPAGPAFSNGSFEAGLTSWTGTGNRRVVSGTSTDGASSVQFNYGQTTPNGVLSQTFGTTVGKTYSVDFSIGAFSKVNQSEQRLEVKVQGNTQLASQVFTVNAPGNGSRFTAKSLSFVANSASTTLTFRDVSATTQSVDMYLDNVRVRTEVTTLNLASLAAASKSTSASAAASASASASSASAAIQTQADRLVVAQGGTATLLKDGASSVLANDSDKAGLSAVLVTPPAHGEVTLQPDGTFIYQHHGGQDLEDSFTYRAGNDVAQSEPVEVKINISGLMVVEKDGADLVISFHTEEGVIYAVQYNTDSSDDQGPWKNLTEAIEGDGEVISLTHPNAATAEQIFYRVQSQRQPTESGHEVSLNR